MLVGGQREGGLRPSGSGRGGHAGAESGRGGNTEVGRVGVQGGKGACSCAIVGGVGGAVGRVDAQAGGLLRSSTVLGEQLCPTLLVPKGVPGESEEQRATRASSGRVSAWGKGDGDKGAHGMAWHDMTR